MSCHIPIACNLPYDQCCGLKNKPPIRKWIYNPNSGAYEEVKTFEQEDLWNLKMSKLTNTVA